MSSSLKRGWRVSRQTVTGASCSVFLFLVSGFWILTSLPAPATVDTNNNGMSDLWEKQHNSDQLYPPTFFPIDDADGDGVSNQDESTAGTDPADGKPPDGFFQAQVIHSPLVSWHGTTSDTNDDIPAYLIGSNQDQVDLPIAVKTMKNRTLRISIFPIRKSTSSPSIEMPDKAILISRLHKVFAYQLNAWALEPVYKTEQVFNYDPDADGILNWPSTEHDDLMNLCVDGDADLIVTLIRGVAYVVSGDVALGSAPPDIIPVVVSTSKPVTTSDLSNLQTISPTDYINTMMHELGHRIVGDGHPDQGGGFAPLVGTDRRWRLMASGDVRIPGARLIVKREWDAAEQWLIANPDSRD